jgi:hypothetical protein
VVARDGRVVELQVIFRAAADRQLCSLAQVDLPQTLGGRLHPKHRRVQRRWLGLQRFLLRKGRHRFLRDGHLGSRFVCCWFPHRRHLSRQRRNPVGQGDISGDPEHVAIGQQYAGDLGILASQSIGAAQIDDLVAVGNLVQSGMVPGDDRLVDADFVGRVTADTDRLFLNGKALCPLPRMDRQGHLGRISLCEHCRPVARERLSGDVPPPGLSCFGLVQRQLEIDNLDGVASLEWIGEVGGKRLVVDERSIGTAQIGQVHLRL